MMSTDEHDITRVLNFYCHTIDRGDIDQWVACFTDDGEYTVTEGGEVTRSLAGHLALREYAITRAAGPAADHRHLLWAPLIDVDPDGLRAVASAKFAILGSGEGGPAMLLYGRYDDTFAREAEGVWRIASRLTTIES